MAWVFIKYKKGNNMENIFKLNNLEVTDVEVDGIDMKDYPDFCDAYIESAKFKGTGVDLDDNELVELLEANQDDFFEAVNDEVLSICDRHYS